MITRLRAAAVSACGPRRRRRRGGRAPARVGDDAIFQTVHKRLHKPKALPCRRRPSELTQSAPRALVSSHPAVRFLHSPPFLARERAAQATNAVGARLAALTPQGAASRVLAMARALLLLAVCCLCADAVAPAAPARRRWQLSPADASAMSSADAATVAAALLELSGGSGGGGGALRGSIGGALRAAGADMVPPPEQGASSGEDATAAADASSKTAKTPKCPKSKLGLCNGKGDCDEACVCRAPRARARAAPRPFSRVTSFPSSLCVAPLSCPVRRLFAALASARAR